MYGHRARIGYTSPPIVTETFPYEFYRIAPEGISLAITTLMVARHSAESGEAEESWNHALRAAREMGRAGVDLVLLGGQPVVYSVGGVRAAQVVEELSHELGIPVTTSATAYREADLALGAKILGSVSYGSPEGAVDHLVPKDLAKENSRYVATKYAAVPFIEVGAIPSEVPLRLAWELIEEHPEIDTIHLGSPHWATAAIIEPLERDLGVNVVQGTQAIVWHSLRLLGIEDRIQGYGRLLTDH